VPHEECLDQSEEAVDVEGRKHWRICKRDGDGEADCALSRLSEMFGITSEVLLTQMQAAGLVQEPLVPVHRLDAWIEGLSAAF